eukprot:2395483-Lingulodinium_polyedra.AAC.1
MDWGEETTIKAYKRDYGLSGWMPKTEEDLQEYREKAQQILEDENIKLRAIEERLKRLATS